MFPESLVAIGPELPSKEFFDEIEVILFAIPTQGLRYVPVAFCAKCEDSMRTYSRYIDRLLRT